MKPLPSIRRRLSQALVVVSLAWSVGVAAVVGLVMRHEMNEMLDDTLLESAQVLQGLLSVQALQLPLQSGGTMPAPPHKENLVWQIVDANQQVLLRSHQAPVHALVAAGTRGFASAGGDWRVHVDELGPEVGQPGLVLMVAQRSSERAQALLEVSLYTAGSALVVSLLCAWWLSLRTRRELQPIVELSQAVGGFDPLQPHAMLPQTQRQELQPMHQAITELGSRLARRMANEHAFTAHAAHALRTPLAGMVAQLAAAQRAPTDQVQAMLGLARQAADRLRRVVAALLTLFRSGSEVQRQPIDLPELVAQLQVDGLTVTVQPGSHLDADPDLLAAALANLLDNALRHGATRLHITLQDEGGSPCVVLADNGPGIAELERLRLQAALDTQDYQSSPGMGLMLADLVARAHGGTLRLPATTAGCTVQLMMGPSRGA
ncbi:MAG: sensor histidine kinase [Burkholderiales bacterium]